MRPRTLLVASPTLLIVAIALAAPKAAERPYGRGLTEANKERLVIDDFENISKWSTGTPIETTLAASDKFVKQGKHSLKFGNVVDYTRGEKDYPIGWPRTNRSLKDRPTDWSDYDFFEFWIYVDTSRDVLPGTPLGLGINHSGHRRSSSFAIKEVQKDQWVKIVIPTARLLDPKDVQGIQFHIAEASYKHGDRVDFYIDDMALTRYVDPTIAKLAVDRSILYGNDRQITALYTLLGHRDVKQVRLEFSIGRGASVAAQTEGQPGREGELPLSLTRPLLPGDYWARLALRDAQGRLIDQRQTEFRVIAGPME